MLESGRGVGSVGEYRRTTLDQVVGILLMLFGGGYTVLFAVVYTVGVPMMEEQHFDAAAAGMVATFAFIATIGVAFVLAIRRLTVAVAALLLVASVACALLCGSLGPLIGVPVALYLFARAAGMFQGAR